MGVQNESPLFNMARDDATYDDEADIEVVTLTGNAARTLDTGDLGKRLVIRSEADTGVTYTLTLPNPNRAGGFDIWKLPGPGENADANSKGAIRLIVKPANSDKLNGGVDGETAPATDAKGLVSDYSVRKARLSITSGPADWGVSRRVGVFTRQA